MTDTKGGKGDEEGKSTTRNIIIFFLIIALAVMGFLYFNPDKAPSWYPHFLLKKETSGQGEDILAGFPDPISL